MHLHPRRGRGLSTESGLVATFGLLLGPLLGGQVDFGAWPRVVLMARQVILAASRAPEASAVSAAHQGSVPEGAQAAVICRRLDSSSLQHRFRQRSSSLALFTATSAIRNLLQICQHCDQASSFRWPAPSSASAHSTRPGTHPGAAIGAITSCTDLAQDPQPSARGVIA